MSLAPLFDAHRTQFADFLQIIDRYADALSAIGVNNPPEPRWDQVWFTRLDACAAYTMVRETKPARIVEIGSGHSTRFLARAIRDGGLATHLTSIDPHPRATLDGLAIERIAVPVQQAGIPPLTAGDVLFVDSSHRLDPGSDVDVILRDIVPRLPAGALIHFHDIFLPDPYPSDWDYRNYNEQQSVAALLASGLYEPVFASRYVATRMNDDLIGSSVAHLPLSEGAFENSLWLRRIRA